MGKPLHILRISRWLLLAAAAVASLALLGAALTNRAAVRGSVDDIHRGQAAVFVASLHGQLQKGPPTELELEAWLATHEEQGLRFVAVLGRDIVSAGESQGGGALPMGTGTEAIVQTGDRVRVMVGGRPPRGQKPRRRRPPPRRFGRPGRPNRPPPPVIIEFEPEASRALLAAADRGILTSGIVSLALLVFAGLGFRWLFGREREEVRLQEQARLAHLGEMSAVLAHEIRNPLASLKGNAQLLEESVAEAGAKDKAARVVKEARRLETLTEGLLAFVRTGEVNLVEADPRAVIRTAAASAGVEPTWELGDAPTQAVIDVDRLEQALSNLFANAREAQGRTDDITAGIWQKGNWLEFFVADRGPGVPVGEEERVFEAFHTNRLRGTGLGLAVVRRIAEAHNGRAWVEQRPGGGAIFVVRVRKEPS